MAKLSDLFNKLKLMYVGGDIVGNTSPNSPLAATGYQFTTTNGTVYFLTIDNAGNIRVTNTNPPVNDGDGNPPALLDPGIRQRATVQLSSAQILALNSTPVTLIAAAGAGKTIIVEEILFTMTTTATQYAGGGNVTFQYSGGNAISNNIAAAVVTAAAGTSYTIREGLDVTAAANTAITITNATAAFTTGTGTAQVDLVYRIV